jgi:hypothetical protein
MWNICIWKVYLFFCEILVIHRSDYEDYCLLGCDAAFSVEEFSSVLKMEAKILQYIGKYLLEHVVSVNIY